ncbi:MAG: 3-dehydroquinate synthase [Bacteroidota bacterium]|nr:3-dehydroquinate synthase [Bacteroidota bacterium]
MKHTQFLYHAAELENILEGYSEIIILADKHTSQLCLPVLQPLISNIKATIIIDSGEQNKTLQSCEKVFEKLMAVNTSRKALMLNVGGGMVCDLGGFCASVYKRGIDYINIPTSLLCMVDAAFGGKTAVNFSQTKNMIGAFYPPKTVFYNTDFLNTLPQRQLYNGFAEMLKHGLIAYADYFEKLCEIDLNNTTHLLPFIQTSIDIKEQIVEEDPHEHGLRKILNAGHTIGHALEATQKDIHHGEAVAWGLLAEAKLSHELGILDIDHLNIIENCINKYYKDSKPINLDYNTMLEKIKNDKKNSNEYISFSLLQQIGTCGYDIEVDLNEEVLERILG